MVNSIKSKLDTFEKHVNTCSPESIEDAARLGEDLMNMNGGDLASFRASITKYKEDCYSVRIPRPTRERAIATLEEAKRLIKTGEEKAAPTVEKIGTYVSPKIEAAIKEAEKAKKEAGPAIEKIKTGAIKKIKEAEKTISGIAIEAEKEIRRESERRAAIARAT